MKADLLHTMIRVKDLDRSVRFYTEVLGLEEQRRKVLEKADATLVFLVDAAGHHPIELTYNHDGRNYELGNQFGHFAFGVADLEGAREELAGHGVEFTRGPYQVGGEGGSTIAFIEDPDGIEIELVERKK
ncbi:MAG: VOC family protein [Gemmatimonadetes bacterium]|nr:VOC family protein [Gemmatimonadota bacterium]